MAFITRQIFKILVILMIIWISLVTSREIREDYSMRERHEQWMAHYGRVYKDIAEKEKRYEIFKSNVEYIEMMNNEVNRSYELGLNEFADLTNEEFRATYIGFMKPNFITQSKSLGKTTSRYVNSPSRDNIPPSVDWRKKGVVTPIRAAGCGAWAIPAVDTVESITKIKTGKLYTLSIQEIIDCTTDSCTTGHLVTDDAFEFIKQHGLTTESNYPYNGTRNTCNTKKEAQAVAKISGYKKVTPAGDEYALEVAVARQPVAVYIDASDAGFQFYSRGVYTGNCGTTLDHGVTVVGYGVTGGKNEDDKNKVKYWILKNSWGTTWGESGYMRLGRGMGKNGGLCGIAIDATYPVV